MKHLKCDILLFYLQKFTYEQRVHFYTLKQCLVSANERIQYTAKKKKKKNCLYTNEEVINIAIYLIIKSF